MKMLTYARRSVLVGDETADAVIAYAARLASLRQTETILLRVLSPRGRPAIAEVLLTPGAELMTLSVRARWAEPDNDTQVAHMRRETVRTVGAPEPGGAGEAVIFDDTEFDSLEVTPPRFN
jgi:hypothetical protein